MNTKYIRLCPVCDTENPAENTRCACGALLAGVDFSLPRQTTAEPPVILSAPAAPSPPDLPVCPHADCAQPNPAGATRCLYCNRPLQLPPAAAPASPLPPSLAVRYSVLEMLPAAGAEADLILIESLADGTKVMAKLYRKGMEPDLDLLAHLAESAHEHVVHIFEHGVADGVSYELMEYCPLGTLRQLLEAGNLGRARLREIVAELAGALAEVHRLHILHRDLKPENVLVRGLEPLDMVLADFGISSMSNATQHFTSVARSTRYAPPEALTGVLDSKADWWSLGMIVLEAATGRHPFAALNEQVINHHLATRSIDTQAVLDADLRLLCRGLLLRDPTRRWGADEVSRWLAGDATLNVPEDRAGNLQVAHPYHIGNAACHSLAELAAGLASHWDIAAKDLRRGSVGNWIENELHDYALARQLRDILDTTAHHDLGLLRFLRVLAPDLPPIWRGIALERDNLIAVAAKALADHLPSRDWLDSVFQQNVLALHDSPELAELNARWRSGFKDFYGAWKQLQAAEHAWQTQPKSMDGEAQTAIVDIDQLMFGRASRMDPPKAARLHPALLMAQQQPAHLDALRKTLFAALAEIGDACPWLQSPGDFAKLPPEGVLAAWLALPVAKEDAEVEMRRRKGVQKSRQDNLHDLLQRIRKDLRKLNDLLRRPRPVARANLDPLLSAMEAVHETNAWAQGVTFLDEGPSGLRDEMTELSEQGFILRARLDQLRAEYEKDAIWQQPRRLLLAGTIVIALGASAGTGTALMLGGGLAGFAIWRFLRLRQQVRMTLDEARRVQSQAYVILGKLA